MDTKTLIEWSDRYHVPTYSRAPICLVRGQGVRVWDSDGREYLDFTAGIAVVALGHCHPRVTGAIQEAAATLIHVSNLFHTAPQDRKSTRLNSSHIQKSRMPSSA